MADRRRLRETDWIEPDRPVTPEQTNQRLRAFPVVEPDHDSMTRFVLFVDVDASTWDALLDVAEAALAVRKRHPMNAESADIVLDRALARLSGERPGD